jgi:glycosyltransferase involved in cell wall biosynthesis
MRYSTELKGDIEVGNTERLSILVPYCDEWYSEFDERIAILSRKVKIYLLKPATKIEPVKIQGALIETLSVQRKIIFLPLISLIIFIKGMVIGRKEKVAIIQAFDPHFSGLIGSLLSKILDRPFLLVVRANYYNGHLLHLKQKYGRLTILAKLRLYILKGLISLSYNTADHIIVKSNFQKRDIENWGVLASKVTAIPTGTDLNMFDRNKLSQEDIDIFKSETLKLKRKDKTVLSFIGRLQPEKGILFLLDIVNGLDPKVKDTVCLLLIGKSIPGYDEKIQNRVSRYGLEDEVNIIPYLDHEKIPLALGASDILVYPTLGNTEGIPVILQEAMAMKVPCLVSDFGGVDEIIENGKDGYILSQDNVNEWVEKIEFLIENEKVRQKLAMDSRNKVHISFNRDRNYEKFHEIYKLLRHEAMQ